MRRDAETMLIRGILGATTAAGAVVALAVSAPGCASARPRPFPDLGGLVDVTSAHILNNPRGQAGFIFAIPDGYGCSGGSNSVICNGALPGMDGIAQAPGTGPCDVGESRADLSWSRLQHFMAGCPGPASGAILSAGQKVTQDSTTCGVLAGGVTACTTGPHGFVLQPAGSYSF